MTANVSLTAGGLADYGVRALADVIARRVVDGGAPTLLFLGAGADITSGGKTFADFKRLAVDRYRDQPFIRLSSEEDVDAAFQRFFTAKQSLEERAALIKTLFERPAKEFTPSDAYKLLVLLGEARAIDAVVTTNFDTLLEQAQHELGRDVFQIYAPGNARPYPVGAQFAGNRIPYVKLHGDLASWTVTVLTQEEIERAQYEASTVALVQHLLQTHDMVIAGYGGRDAALAELIATSVSGTKRSVFWCDRAEPSPTSALATRLAGRFDYVRATFDTLIYAIAEPVLRRPRGVARTPIYLAPVFQWRLDHANDQFVNDHARVGSASPGTLFVSRSEVMEQVDAFLTSDRALAVVVGPTGYGKSTLGLLLRDTWVNTNRHMMLVRSRAVTEGDFESYVAEQLGALGASGPFSLILLHRWLREQDRNLVIFVDAVNERGTTLQSSIDFFRGIVTACADLPEGSAIRVIATMRQETWSAILPFVDTAELRQTLWSESDDAFRAIAIDELTDTELQTAVDLLRDHAHIAIDLAQLTAGDLQRLKDPYVLRMIAEEGASAVGSGATPLHLAESLKRRLTRHFTTLDAGLLQRTMGRLAVRLLADKRDTFSDDDFAALDHASDVLRVMKDLRVILETEPPGNYRFGHDRIHEYFLSVGFAQSSAYVLTSTPVLRKFLRDYATETKTIAGARLFFTLDARKRLPSLEPLFLIMDDPDGAHDEEERGRLFAFAKAVLVEVTDIDPQYAAEYITSGIREAMRGDQHRQRYLRTLVQAATRLPVETAVSILSVASRANDAVAAAEADIFAIDRLVATFLLSGRASTDLLSAHPYATFFADPEISPWKRVGRLLAFIAQVGPDNTHPLEYEQLCAAAGRALRSLTAVPWTRDDGKMIAAHLFANCDRLIFNRTEDGLRAFFGSTAAGQLLPLLDKLETEGTLEAHDLDILESFAREMTTDQLEFHIAHALMLLSALNDPQATFRLWCERFDAFDAETSAIKIDFYQAALIYLMIVTRTPYGGAFAAREERLLREPDFHDARVYQPGAERGQRRGFLSEFEQIFEDGFGIIYPYGVLHPGTVRQRMRFADYQRHEREIRAQPLPLYHEYLQRFVREQRFTEALQLLQTLSGVATAWPTEALMTLRDVIGHPHADLRRATIRTLAEAYYRHPAETARFLQRSGSALTEADLDAIRVGEDPHIGRRQVDEEQWARILHFFSRQPEFIRYFAACLRAVLEAVTAEHAIDCILGILGVYGSERR